MITLEAIRTALSAADPYEEMDQLVLAEMASGRKVQEIFDAINPVLGEVLDTPGLTEHGEEAILGTIDKLTGGCQESQCYYDPPNLALPTQDEIAKLPRWARVAFAARCARRVSPLFKHHWADAPREYVAAVTWAVEVAEEAAATCGTKDASAPAAIACAAYVCDAVLTANRDRKRAVEVIKATSTAVSVLKSVPVDAADAAVVVVAQNASIAIANAVTPRPPKYGDAEFAGNIAIRRDFDRLDQYTKRFRWTDDTPVQPSVFDPLWLDAAPSGWPTDTEVPHHGPFPSNVLDGLPPIGVKYDALTAAY